MFIVELNVFTMGVPILMVGEKMQPNAFKLHMALYVNKTPITPGCSVFSC